MFDAIFTKTIWTVYGTLTWKLAQPWLNYITCFFFVLEWHCFVCFNCRNERNLHMKDEIAKDD